MRPLTLSDGTVLDLDHVVCVRPTDGGSPSKYKVVLSTGEEIGIYENCGEKDYSPYMSRSEFIRKWTGQELTTEELKEIRKFQLEERKMGYGG